MSIVRRNDAPRDASAPALLRAYQAYGVVDRPSFRPVNLTWIDRGGVYAECHGRGSGNRGKQWHLDGVKRNKERGVEDYIACAEYLVANKYTATARLTGTSASAGGVLVGGAITRRPDLYAAALLRVPAANLLRSETTEGGAANVPEKGALADELDFKPCSHRIRIIASARA